MHPTSADPSLADETAHFDILAVIEEAASAQRCLTGAVTAAKILPTPRLTALHIEVDPLQIRTAAEEVSIQQLRVQKEGSAQERAAGVRRMYELWLADNASLNARWVCQVGTVSSVLVEAASASGLVVLARPHNLDAFDSLHAALFDAGKLVLYMPDAFIPGNFYQHIAISWKHRSQALRAVQAALPWLQAADKVTIIAIDEHGSDPNMDEILLWLGTNAIRPIIHTVSVKEGEHTASCLLREASQIGAQSLVMGAYRFGEVMEWLFGGVTRQILHNVRMPVFLKH